MHTRSGLLDLYQHLASSLGTSAAMSVDTIDPEKKGNPVSVTETPVRDDPILLDSGHGDQALKLVGEQRRAQFSDGYNAQLRRKLVGGDQLQSLVIPRC
jgi:hypothetical protein